MTNHWIDYQNSDVIMVIGANPAENHPLAMKWINRARETRQAKLIVVDPRVSRTAQQADLHVRIRPGTDIAYLGGLIDFAMRNNRFNKDYLVAYTNAAYLIHPDYKFSDGMFSGAGGGEGPVNYDTATWTYQKDDKGNFKTDPTLQDPQTVFQLMKQQYSRYDVRTVCNVTGCSPSDFEKAANLFTGTGLPGKAGNLVYAMGITQSTHGAQNVRATAMLQLLLGNVGIAGGGVNAQRGESNVQGSTDMGILYGNLPGYNPYPQASRNPTLAKYLEMEVPRTSYWANRNKFLISNLKAWWGDKATSANDFAYDYLPKGDGRNHSHIGIFDDMAGGKIKGFFVWGQNPAVAGPNAAGERAALAKLDWLVVVDLFESETAAFWKAPETAARDIKTEVFLLPAAASFEREGSITNSGRWIQWRWQALDPPGEAKRDLWIADRLFKAIRSEYARGGVFPDPIVNLKWDYGDGPDVTKVAVELNGYTTADGKPLLNFTKLAADGSTACGNWIYSGYYNDLEKPPAKSRIKEKEGIGLHAQWGFAWPVNRRVLYNRVSADAAGKPWADDPRWVVKWDGAQWLTRDVPDFGWKNADNSFIPPATSAANPFIMQTEGRGRLFAISGLKDGPFPEHYEPMESPVSNALSKVQNNPAVTIWKSEIGKLARQASPDLPIIATTMRLTEHYQSGVMTRGSPWLAEAQPEMFAEISPTLAEKLDVKNGDMIQVTSARSAISVHALVTRRVAPLLVGGKQVELIALPFHWGFAGTSPGASANDLSPHVGDPNTTIPEYKAFLCNVSAATGVE